LVKDGRQSPEWIAPISDQFVEAATTDLWMANQTGNSLSGPVTPLTSPAVTDITFSGTLTGTIGGSQLSLTFVAVPGAVSGSANCSSSGTGSATATSITISGSLDVSFVSCDGLGLQPPANNQLTLTKQ